MSEKREDARKLGLLGWTLQTTGTLPQKNGTRSTSFQLTRPAIGQSLICGEPKR